LSLRAEQNCFPALALICPPCRNRSVLFADHASRGRSRRGTCCAVLRPGLGAAPAQHTGCCNCARRCRGLSRAVRSDSVGRRQPRCRNRHCAPDRAHSHHIKRQEAVEHAYPFALSLKALIGGGFPEPAPNLECSVNRSEATTCSKTAKGGAASFGQPLSEKKTVRTIRIPDGLFSVAPRDF
jgi:hypothetical protein